MISRILVANRGEIAVRVMRTAKALGYETVAIYSEADANALHVKTADYSVCIGPPPVGESYLNADRVLDAVKCSGADAVHPGYGFLSENTAFAEKCQAAGVTFIGPPSEAIELMGNKRLAKLAMIDAGVPCIPGYEGADQSDSTLSKEAQAIGFPVMAKATAGGGGRGMRLIHSADECLEQLQSARSEALNAFGSDELILEKAVVSPRHIEIQVFADQHGEVVYLGERDCSIQRRHQKVVEEAPSPFVDEELRAKMGVAAVNAAKACGYVGAGTVEFLVDQDKAFYFLEMNTRLQVEHPVTELITGVDLVAWQIAIAEGVPLPLSQEQIQLSGHAVEVRLYAEDPENNFLPQTGTLLKWAEPALEGARFDSGVETGQVVSPFYDPMLAKIIAYGSNRDIAIRKLNQAIKGNQAFGVKTNSAFLSQLINHEAFKAGEATTAFIEQHFDESQISPSASETEFAVMLGAVVFYSGQSKTRNDELDSWSNNLTSVWTYKIRAEDHDFEVALSKKDDTYSMTLADDSEMDINLVSVSEQSIEFVYQGLRQSCFLAWSDDGLWLKVNHRYHYLQDHTHARQASQDSAGDGRLTASMDGSIIDIKVEVGDSVSKGQTLAVLEAMKMEHPLKADSDGVVSEINAKIGDQVKFRQLLLVVESQD